MKKLILSTLFAVLTYGAFSLEAVVVSTKGKAEVKSGEKWVQLENGASLKTGAVIQTGFKSEAVLKIKGTTVTVAPLSRITLEQLVSTKTKDDTKIFLDTGSLKSDVKKIDDKRAGFTVHSPVATASVRGTVLTVKNGFRSTSVVTHEGVVAVWKSKNASPAVEAEEESAVPVAETAAVENAASESSEKTSSSESAVAATEAPKAGNSASAVSDGDAPAGAFTVTRGQTAGFASSGATTTAQSNAVKTALAMPASTQSAAAAESVATSVSAPASVPTSTSEKLPSKGKISVSIDWID